MSRFFYISLLFLVTCSSAQGGAPEHDCSRDVSSSSEESSSSESEESTEHIFRCPKNEEFLKKKPSCPPDTCAALVARIDCSKAPPPKPGCRCKSGYRRLNGKCVPYCDCPQVANTPDCLAQKCNGPNEEFVQEKSTCPGDTCRALVIRVDCSNAPPPQPGCTCKSGYFRKFNETSPCVPLCECQEMASSPECQPKVPSLFCGVNEEVQCVTGCPPEKTCKNRDIEYACPAVVLPCKDACVCKPGYFRNSIGDCITRAECEQCSKPNEFFSCGGACDNECSTLSKQNRTNCPIVNIVCNKMCYCEDGYARDKKGNCIPINKCQPTIKPLSCGPFEEERCMFSCPSEYKTCRNRNVKFMCKPETKPCQRKCVCISGYYRNSIGECVTKAQCDKCSKPHEFFSCGSACDNECRNIQTQNRTNCPIRNKKCNKKCYCDDGYARDHKGNCIPVKQCPPPCKDPNEENVFGKSCPPDTCISLVARFKCNSNEIDKYRCRCKPGYLRLKAGSRCVPICKCPQMANSPDCK